MISAFKSFSFWLVNLSSLLLVTVVVVVVQGMSVVERCAVVGVGVLGTSLCQQILSEFPQAHVTGITRTTANHESIQNLVSSDRLRLVTLDQELENEPKFENVVFCAPPSGSEDYPAAVQKVITKYWAGPDTGVFVFTSSGAV
jgi:prephenate dehydrogenase